MWVVKVSMCGALREYEIYTAKVRKSGRSIRKKENTSCSSGTGRGGGAGAKGNTLLAEIETGSRLEAVWAILYIEHGGKVR
jgi:hypothetical protein